MSGYRTEADSMGSIQVPDSALYGAQTQRAVDNFTLGGGPLPAPLIKAIIAIKRAAASANAELGQLTNETAKAIIQACDKIGTDELVQQFPVDTFQTGSGTSSNMNVNEVLAHLASELLGDSVHPNDHINASQSSNDVFPSAIRVATAIEITTRLLPALAHLQAQIRNKTETVGHIVKTGRTHLMDAMPVTFAQVLGAWADQIDANQRRLDQQLEELLALPQGGTAVGTGINAHPDFAGHFNQALARHTGLAFRPTANAFTKIGAQDDLVALSGTLKTTAVSLIKIANDLRWMNSGPLAGLSEITLPALQPGSSIMPGKINPVIPEAVLMASTQVIGYDTAVTIAGQSGNFELNVMLPLMGTNLLTSINLLSNSAHSLADKAISGFTVNQTNIDQPLARNPILVTALNTEIGYTKAASIAKQAYAEGRDIIDVAAEQTTIPREALAKLLNPAKLANPGNNV
ncbi:MAG TPA: class II fumarate hydratase [Cellvibrionaceae bacterium]